MAAAKARTRKDPRRRRADGAFDGTRLLDRRDDKHYVLVSLNDGAHSVEYYEAIGYEIVRRGDGPRLLAGKTVKESEPIEYRGHVLMSIDRVKHEEIVEYGPDGGTGQAQIDELEERIVERRGGLDPLRGMHSRFYSVEKNIEPNKVEIE